MIRVRTRHASLLFAVLMGMAITFIVTCVVTAVNTGIGSGFLLRWMRAFVFAWPVASICIMLFAHRVRSVVERLTAPGSDA